jgi:uncharacterized DUF497 family protein
MRWTWDPEKNRTNKRKHGLSFETAQLVFDDPLALSRPDTSSVEEERWQTVGSAGGIVVLFVVHTWPSSDATGEEIGRIIGARKATRLERRAYEEGAF